MQVRDFVRREQGPVPVFGDALHEQVRDPVGRVHVVCTASIVTGVLAQVEELLDIDMPAFQVSAHRALALAALVDGHRGVIGHFQEGDNALGFAIGALDVRAHAAYPGPVIAEAAGILGQQRIVLDRAEYAVQVIRYRGQVAAGQLRAQRTGVEQGWCRAHEVERRQQLVELDGAFLAVDLVDGQTHRNAHEECLRQLETSAVGMNEVAVVQGLQAEVGELVVTFGQKLLAEMVQIVLEQARVQQFQVDCTLDVFVEIIGIQRCHFVMGRMGQVVIDEAERLGAHIVQQQACRGIAVIRLFLNQRACTHHQHA